MNEISLFAIARASATRLEHEFHEACTDASLQSFRSFVRASGRFAVNLRPERMLHLVEAGVTQNVFEFAAASRPEDAMVRNGVVG